MMEKVDRRARGINRVPVERVVEICGRDERVPAFEAESVELSGRGMHVRTPYLPELAAPLVCRLEDRGREIVVEGVVAWCKETDLGGEFGIKFTALDSGSVETLKELCGLSAPSPKSEAAESAPAPPVEDEAVEKGPQKPPRGAAVKLHIDGLGAPMRARVRRAGVSRLHVGSNLEFLKIGRSLEIEDVEQQRRASAHIDAVSVAIDPQEQVPELVVTLRYDDIEDRTPEPTVVDEEEAPQRGSARSVSAKANVAEGPPEDLDVDFEDEDDEDDFLDENPFGSGLGKFANKAAEAAQSTGSALLRLGTGTAKSMGRILTSSAEGRARRPRQQKPRHPGSARAGGAERGRRLRPQSGKSRASETEAAVGRKKAIALSAIALSAALGLSAYAFGPRRDVPLRAPAAKETAPQAEPKAPPAAKLAPAESEKPTGAKANERGIVADVPLFGPTPMATLEPAPLEPPPDDMESQATESNVPDETFVDKEAAKSTNPKDVKQWGNGRLHLPFVHHLRLDGPGAVLEGRKQPTGFSVFVPGRKLLDSGTVISGRDDRIIKVEIANDPDGARINVVFRGEIPAYKVRLRDAEIEFFINTPGDGD